MALFGSIAFAFVILLSLQSKSISHSSSQQRKADAMSVAMLVRQRSQRSIQHLNQLDQRNLNSNADNKEELATAAAAAIHNKHLLQHFEHKRLQHLQHDEQLLLKQEPVYTDSDQWETETVPHLWQLLQSSANTKEQLSNERDSLDANSYKDLLLQQLLPTAAVAEQSIETSRENIVIDDASSSKEIIFKVPIMSASSNGNSSSSKAAAMHEFRCPRCENARKVETISEEELTRLRIEFVKQQILEKLRLKEPPKFSAKDLPRPIYEGTTIDEHDDLSHKDKDLDDYYARTSKKFIFLQRETEKCQQFGGNRSICFSFKINDADADGYDVNTAVLWIFKNRLPKHNFIFNDQETIMVSELQQSTQTNAVYIPIMKPIAMQTVDVQDKWMKINIDWPIRNWFGKHELHHIIHINCQSCDVNSMADLISADKDYRPFIIVDTQNRRRVSRQKRSINCSDGITACCREKLYISFDEIGWGDWIVQPRGYDAYFCRGSCDSVASITQSSSHHNTFMQRFIAQRRSNGNRPLELIPCCTAKQYSSLQLVFMDSNNTATQKTFPNMVVESCGCR